MNFKISFRVFIVIAAFALCSCNSPDKIKTGEWRGVLSVNEQYSLPFLFEIINEGGMKMIIKNDTEKFVLDDISFQNDSVVIRFPVFDSELRFKNNGKELTGSWHNYMRTSDNVIPFYAQHGITERFDKKGSQTDIDIGGKWKLIFTGEKDSSVAIAMLKQDGSSVSGTILTPTGDYRYLEGIVKADSLYLSTFNGSHTFLFAARIIRKQKLSGKFFSGKHWSQPWTGERNDSFELPSPDSLTWINEGFSSFEFSFPDKEGNPVSLRDEKFRNKTVLIQIMGTWCPNCHDQANFLTDYYNKNKSRVEIIAIAFEKTEDTEKIKRNLEKFSERYKINYTILYGGNAKKEEASAKLPMLNKVYAFPTLIFIDRKGAVRSIYTGFSGPATGMYYEKFVTDFEDRVQVLDEMQ